MKTIGLKKTLILTMFWFGYNFLWGALLTVVIPSNVTWLVGSSAKAVNLSITLAIGALIAMFTQPIAGALSDRSRFRWGKRKLFILCGTGISVPALVFLGIADNIVAFIAALMVLELAANSAVAGFQGLIPDTVQETDRGRISSVLGVMLFIGTFLSTALFGFLSDQKMYLLIYVLCAAVMVVCSAITGLGVKEETPAPGSETKGAGGHVSLKDYADFIWLVVTYFLYSMAFYLVADYLQYYLSDIIHSQAPAGDSSIVMIVVLVAATVTTIFAGKWSDKYGRKKIVLLGSLLMGAAALIMVFSPSFAVLLLIAVLIGLGYGLFIAVQWAFVSDCMPSKNDFGKDMGIFSIAIIAPQVLAPIIGGLLFSVFAMHRESSYAILFSLAVMCFLLCGLTVYRIKKIR